jgi:hypothetical protein
MLPVIKYIWPLWIGLIMQLSTEIASEFVLADWVFSRKHSLRRPCMVVDVEHCRGIDGRQCDSVGDH